MTKRRSGFTIVTLLLAALALLLSGLFVPATAAATGGVKGVVSSGGKPVAGLTVQLMRSDTEGESWTRIATDTTDSKGSYSFSGVVKVADGYYHLVRVSDPHGRYVLTERSFSPVSGKAVTRNVTMQPAGTLTGKVFRADGASPTTTRVHLIGPDITIGDPDQSILAYDDDRGVNAGGTYRFAGLPPGKYTVRYTDTSGTYLDQCYDAVLATQGSQPTCDSAEVPAATVVTVAARATSTLDDQQLEHAGGQVSGTVTSTAGGPLKSIYVTPVPQGSDSRAWYDYLKGTSSAGTFARGPIPSGQWQLYVEDPHGIWASQWFDGTNQAGAHVFDISPGQNVGAIAIKLKSRAVLKAKVTAGAKSATFVISVTRKLTGSYVSGEVTASLGTKSKSATLAGGKATIKLTGISAGKQTFTVHFNGNGNTSTATTHPTTTVR
jgi:hypothetical protein